MKRAWTLSLVPALAACNLVLGIRDRKLDPGTGASGGSGGASATSTGSAMLSLSVAPGAPSVNVIGTGSLPLTITRSGVTGPANVLVKNLPPNVTFDALTIPEGMTTGTLVFHDGGAKQGIYHATVEVTAGSPPLSAIAPVDVVVRGLPGTPDMSFGTNGVVAFTTAGDAHAIALDSKGRIVVVGSVPSGTPPPTPPDPKSTLLVARYMPDGTLDTTFAGTSQMRFPSADPPTNPMSIADSALAVAIDANDRVVVAVGQRETINSGTSWTYELLTRFDDQGKLDTSFGTLMGHEVAIGTQKWNTAWPSGITMISQGAIVVVGNFGYCPSVAAFDSNGTLQNNGVTLCAPQPSQAIAAELVALPGNSVVLVGSYFHPDLSAIPVPDNYLYLAKYDVHMTLDPSWGTVGDGTSLLDHRTGPVLRERLDAGVRQADGSIVAVGTDSFISPAGIIALRVDSKGQPDTGYGKPPDHLARVDVGMGSTPSGAALDSNGNVVVAGTTGAAGSSKVVLFRLDKTGALDSSNFGTAGLVETSAGATSAIAEGLVLDAAGRIVVTGSAQVGGQTEVLLARFWP